MSSNEKIFEYTKLIAETGSKILVLLELQADLLERIQKLTGANNGSDEAPDRMFEEQEPESESDEE